jgi:uncharacterized repeat protein (TIGR02543 family)
MLGHSFSHWSLSGQTTPYDFDTPVTQNIFLTAVWEAHRYTVVYERNRPANASSQITGSTLSSLHTWSVARNLTSNGYSLAGYTFMGWNTQSDGSGDSFVNGQSVLNLTSVANARITLFAQWQANNYTVSFNSNGSVTTQQVTFDQTYGALPTPSNPPSSDHWFDGWWTQPNGGGTRITENSRVTNASNHTLHAWWRTNTYAVYFNSSGAVVDNKLVDFNQAYGTLPSALQPPTVNHWFDGWWTQPNGLYGGGVRIAETTVVTNPSSHTLFAWWRLFAFTVDFDLNGGVDTGHYGTQTVDYDTLATKIPNPEHEDYYYNWLVFSHWEVESTGQIFNWYIPITQDIVLIAVWECKSFVLWDGSIATGFAGGDGSEFNPYQISNGAELAFLAQGGGSGAHYVLTRNIYLAGHHWTPISTFSGVFDGAGNVIYNLNVSGSTNQGLFGVIIGATIKNLGIRESYISGHTNVGGIAGVASQSNIINCFNEDGVVYGGFSVGGIVGAVISTFFENHNFRNTLINNSYNTSFIEGSQHVGGIAGRIQGNNRPQSRGFTLIQYCHKKAQRNTRLQKNKRSKIEKHQANE